VGARQKLNIAYFHGCLIGAAVVGLILRSWPAFLVALALLVGLGTYGGDIRPAGRRR
jgi:hypothetical protein